MNKINLYKDALIKYIQKSDNYNYNDHELSIGILFLIIMNRYCKNNNINAHGYFISHAFIKNYNYILNNQSVNISIIIDNIIKNIEYIATRNNVLIIKKITNNFYFVSKEIIKIFNDINTEKNHDIFYKTSKFLYIVLLISEFITTGEYDNPNMIKLGEYFAYFLLTNFKCINVKDFQRYNDLLIESLDNLNLNSETIQQLLLFIKK